MKQIETEEFGSKKWKRELRKAKAKQKLNDFCEMVRENKDVIIPLIPVVTVVVDRVAKVTTKVIQHHKVSKEIDYKQRTIYDHSLGRYVELKRKLTPEQALTIEERRASGEKLHIILNDMGLLKK